MSDISKTWTFRISNPSEKDFEWAKNIAIQVPRMVCTFEHNEDGITNPHLHGFIVFKQAKRFAAMKKNHGSAYWASALAVECAATYPIKIDSVVIVNKNESSQGMRSDLSAAYDAVESNVNLREFMLTNRPSLQTIQVYKIARQTLRESPDWRELHVESVCGITGSGKSHYANAMRCQDGRRPWTVVRGREEICWDSYDGQDTIVFNDYRPDYCSFETLLNILDGYPLELRCRYVNTHALWTKVIFTSIEDILTMWRNRTTEDIGQLRRRLHEIVTVTVTEVGKGNTSFTDSSVQRKYSRLNIVTNTISEDAPQNDG